MENKLRYDINLLNDIVKINNITLMITQNYRQ